MFLLGIQFGNVSYRDDQVGPPKMGRGFAADNVKRVMYCSGEDAGTLGSG